MKILHCCLALVGLCMLNIANAEIVSADLSQDNKKINIELKGDDILSVKYNIDRWPILRSSEWSYYAIWCTADGGIIEYNLREKTRNSILPALLSDHDDQQKVGLNIDDKGVFKIKSNSHSKLNVSCELYNKFGM